MYWWGKLNKILLFFRFERKKKCSLDFFSLFCLCCLCHRHASKFFIAPMNFDGGKSIRDRPVHNNIVCICTANEFTHRHHRWSNANANGNSLKTIITSLCCEMRVTLSHHIEVVCNTSFHRTWSRARSSHTSLSRQRESCDNVIDTNENNNSSTQRQQAAGVYTHHNVPTLLWIYV